MDMPVSLFLLKLSKGRFVSTVVSRFSEHAVINERKCSMCLIDTEPH